MSSDVPARPIVSRRRVGHRLLDSQLRRERGPAQRKDAKRRGNRRQQQDAAAPRAAFSGPASRDDHRYPDPPGSHAINLAHTLPAKLSAGPSAHRFPGVTFANHSQLDPTAPSWQLERGGPRGPPKSHHTVTCVQHSRDAKGRMRGSYLLASQASISLPARVICDHSENSCECLTEAPGWSAVKRRFMRMY